MKRSITLALLAIVFLAAGPTAHAQLPPGTIVYSHEDSGSPDPAQKYFNLWLMDTQNPTQPVQITSFANPPLLASTPIWSKDFSQLAFTSNFNNGLSSLEEDSIYSIYPDGSNVQQITGFGVLNPLPPPTGTIVGHVQATGGPLNGCVASVQGAPQNVDCSDGSFRITDVPVSSAWVRVQGFVVGPGLELGFSAINVTPDAETDVGTINIIPQIPKSIEPSWSRDGTQLVMTNEVTGRRFMGGEWTPFVTHQLTVWTADGQFVRGIPNPVGLEAFGSDWSPVDDRIAFAAAGSSAYQSYIYLSDPDGRNLQRIYSVPFPPYILPIVTFCRWSPDGQRIAFIQVSDPVLGGQWWADLYVINRDGSGLVQITGGSHPGLFTAVPTWSPDGQALAFEYDLNRSVPPAPTAESGNLFAVNLNDPGTFYRLTDDDRSYNPTWGPR